MLLEFGESGCPIFRATTPLTRGKLKRKGHGKLSIHFAADDVTIDTIFRIILSVNQLSVYGAVAALCEEFESFQDRSGQLDVLMGQSIVLSEIKAEVLLENDIPSHQNHLLQRYEERIELFSQENKVSKFCMDAGFIHAVQIEQYFMTKDTEGQFFVRAGREYNHPRNDESSQPKGGFRETQELDPYWKSRPVICTVNMELKFESGLRVKIILNLVSHGSNKFVIDSNYNNTEIPADLLEEQAAQLIVQDFAGRSKAKAKPQRREPVDHSPSIIPMNERKWIDIEPAESSLSLRTKLRRK